MLLRLPSRPHESPPSYTRDSHEAEESEDPQHGQVCAALGRCDGSEKWGMICVGCEGRRGKLMELCAGFYAVLNPTDRARRLSKVQMIYVLCDSVSLPNTDLSHCATWRTGARCLSGWSKDLPIEMDGCVDLENRFDMISIDNRIDHLGPHPIHDAKEASWHLLHCITDCTSRV